MEISFQNLADTGFILCSPDVGSPIGDVAVSYYMTARTLSDNDTYSCKGTVSKKE